MTDKLALLIWAATPEHPELLVTPLIHALAARALDAEVEIHFAGPAVRWLVEGVADAAYAAPSREKAIGDFLREVVAEDVRLLACSMACAAWVGAGETLIPPAGAAGATAFVGRALDPAWRTLVF
ncbi:DsrE family protein [Dechloromonas denitrificans]|uniref:DsrE family protein n=1 Tax=Dechloromonas denitrificans TaxID=281362 RepID=UPI001CFC207C|nr:DsrE family protein [Dechloromonas denitrificans]UCV07677.1 DsrE family protein [Dechloromonas denitrificans]